MPEPFTFQPTRLSASPIVFVSASAIAALQASGYTRTPLAIGIVVNILHVASNRVLILVGFGVHAMGMRGAGISTSVALTLEAVLAIAALMRRDRPVSLLRTGARTAFLVDKDQYGFARTGADDSALVMISTSAEPVTLRYTTP